MSYRRSLEKAALACSLILPAIGLGAHVLRAESNVSEKLYSGLQWRLVGPFRGGRTEAVAGIAGNPRVYYFGSVAGGVWKTTDGGLNWTPIFDQEPVLSIGAMAVAPSATDTIYVGTGEPCLRNDITSGDGVYKSTDGGRTWRNIGLGDTRQIATILIDPHDANRVFVAALGHPYGPNAERGVFRSTDGGNTWQKILYVDENTGANDVVFDPANPNVLYASMYQVRRTPYSLTSGGPGSGLYKSTDGGNAWKRLDGGGMPAGILGRIGVAVAAGGTGRVYAMIESKGDNALYRSEDGGGHWRMVNHDPHWVRPWYFNHVFADPKNPDTVYVLDLGLYRSNDGGQTFKALPTPHGDHHALWIDPENTRRMIEGNDGGATISVDDGASFSAENNQPTAQFYHVAADDRFNYWIYGSQQDSGSVAIASRTDTGTITDKNWRAVGGGECGFICPDPRDSEIVYAGAQNGLFTRYDGHTGQEQIISPWPGGARSRGPAELEHRFQWTSPMVLAANDPDDLYIAGEVVFRSRDGGMSWNIISPDLTHNDKSKQQSSGGPLNKDDSSAEYYDTIYALAESPLDKNLLWAGSDDGLVHITRDGGQNWGDVTPKQMPEWSRVNLIAPSHFDAGTAYLAADNHASDDSHPYIYKTTDFGQTWTTITSGLPEETYVHAVTEDPAKKGLLFAGTDAGVYVSFDDGGQWQTLQLNLPHVPIYDLTVHGDDLIVATHGRAFWVLDDITPLRQAGVSVAQEQAYLFAPATAYREHRGGSVIPGPGAAAGQNPPAGAVIDYYLKSAPASPITLEIVDASGGVVREFNSETSKEQGIASGYSPEMIRVGETLPAAAGMNRFVWNLQYEGPRRVPGMVILELLRGGGPLALPGKYEVRLSAGGKVLTAPLEVKADPRVRVSQDDLRKQFDFAMKIRDSITEAHNAVVEIRETRAALEKARRASHGAGGEIDSTEDKMTSVEGSLIQLRSISLEGSLQFPIMLDAQLADLEETVESADSAPPAQTYQIFEGYQTRLHELLGEWRALQGEASKLDRE
jgi:photosystem II stability/assembly factor-like uncharacterized protein